MRIVGRARAPAAQARGHIAALVAVPNGARRRVQSRRQERGLRHPEQQIVNAQRRILRHAAARLQHSTPISTCTAAAAAAAAGAAAADDDDDDDSNYNYTAAARTTDTAAASPPSPLHGCRRRLETASRVAPTQRG